LRAHPSRKPSDQRALHAMPRKRHFTWYLLALAALAAVFVLYTRPDFLLQLSNQLWACF
jgi:hypothetical protein